MATYIAIAIKFIRKIVRKAKPVQLNFNPGFFNLRDPKFADLITTFYIPRKEYVGLFVKLAELNHYYAQEKYDDHHILLVEIPFKNNKLIKYAIDLGHKLSKSHNILVNTNSVDESQGEIIVHPSCNMITLYDAVHTGLVDANVGEMLDREFIRPITQELN